MSFGQSELLASLAELLPRAGPARRFVVALSGGLDSSVLVHALSATRGTHGVPIVAVHVDHGLHPESAAWAEHCRELAARLGIEFLLRQVTVDTNGGQGPEAAAREARYGALRHIVAAGDWLLSAHHADDQAETVLLNLMRGSGAAGLAGIPASRRFGAGWLLRPLLGVDRGDLEAYAREQDLAWLQDPANDSEQFDRNFLRHEILPRLDARWPGAASRIRRSAELAREADMLLAELAQADRELTSVRVDRLSISRLAQLSPERQRNLLRHLILDLGLPAPGAAHLESIVDSLVPARADAMPVVSWPGASARRYRDQLYLLAASEQDEEWPESIAVVGHCIELPHGMGTLEFEDGAPAGLSAAVVQQGLELRFRVGGEKFKPVGQRHTRKLKKLLQEAGVVPWMREYLPLVYSGQRLVAVADLWIAADAADTPGTAINWRNRPAMH